MILGKLIPFSILGIIAVTLVLSVMTFWFGIEVKGSIVFLFFCSFVFMLSTLGLDYLSHNLPHTAAGNDNGSIPCDNADDISFRIFLSDRKHA
jgi:Na+/melibiose symporter-like transporter